MLAVLQALPSKSQLLKAIITERRCIVDALFVIETSFSVIAGWIYSCSMLKHRKVTQTGSVERTWH